MSGVISPTNLSLFSAPVAVNSPRSGRHPSAGQPRWNTQNAASAPPFISLEEEYMMTPLIAGTTAEGNATLMDDGMRRSRKRNRFEKTVLILNSVSFVSERYFSTVVHTSDGMETDIGGPSPNGSHTPPSRSGNSPVTNKSQNS